MHGCKQNKTKQNEYIYIHIYNMYFYIYRYILKGHQRKIEAVPCSALALHGNSNTPLLKVTTAFQTHPLIQLGFK